MTIDFKLRFEVEAISKSEIYCAAPYDLTDDTGARPFTTFFGGLAITIVKFLVVIAAKITFFEFFHQPLLFHGTASGSF